MGPAVAHVYRYAGASALAEGSLYLATSGGAEQAPFFFSGTLARPRLTADLLRALSRIVGARFYVPPAMLASILAAADPVVTCGAAMLRFEGFSACASAHARVDLAPDAYDADLARSGTTNVDFNAGMRAALASVRDADRVRLQVGADWVTLERAGTTVVERKVMLPVRWLKSFVEVQAYQARMAPRFTLPGAEALRFLRSLPRASTSRHGLYVVPAGRGVRLSATAAPGALATSGVERLRVLEDVAPFARSLTAYGDDDGQASAWELDFGGLRYTLTLSEKVWRGFSGEGQALSALARRTDRGLVARARAGLKWQSVLRAGDFAPSLGVGEEAAARALAALGARGLVGFDLGARAYFHREMPFDLKRVEALQPRLTAARKLLAAGGVEARDGEVLVRGSDVVHRVRLGDGGVTRCTCPWFAKHQATRGPCKHVLAAQLATEGDEA
jgi:hypothetical protein